MPLQALAQVSAEFDINDDGASADVWVGDADTNVSLAERGATTTASMPTRTSPLAAITERMPAAA